MEARLVHAALLAATVVSLGAGYRTQNFIVQADRREIAEEVGQAAEKYRRDLAIEWLGQPMRNWSQPCPISVQVSPTLGAGGATSFIFDRGEVFDWKMTIQGSRERVLDSVLPHEVTHTIFATYFRRPLPRWADEGASSTVEHTSERQKQQRMLIAFLQTRRGIPFNDMFRMKQYPQDILPLYAQGHSLATFLMAQGGKRKFLKYVKEGLSDENWTDATRSHYRFSNLGELQTAWLAWVRRGSPLPLSKSTGDEPDAGDVLVQAEPPSQFSGGDRSAGAERDDRSDGLAGPLAAVPGPVMAQSSRAQPVEPTRTVVLEWEHGAATRRGATGAVASDAATGKRRSVYERRGKPATP
ncbi:MAG TPA: hypothetical protein VFW87_01255 [Pirellulales bacterium]|nr:hypothetical protein [Pirellulales bacterium]